MARLETKTVKVHPSQEEFYIDTYARFGYSLFSRNEVYSKDSHLEKGYNGSVNQVTETTNYVSLTFQRDKDMPYYQEICAIEKKFFTTYDVYVDERTRKPAKVMTVFGVILIVVGVILFVAKVTLWGVLAWLVGVALIVLRAALVLPKHRKEVAQLEANCNKYRKEAGKYVAV